MATVTLVWTNDRFSNSKTFAESYDEQVIL